MFPDIVHMYVTQTTLSTAPTPMLLVTMRYYKNDYNDTQLNLYCNEKN